MAKKHDMITVRMDPDLHRDLKELAHQRYQSLNVLCDTVLHAEVCRAKESGELEAAAAAEGAKP